MTTKGKRRQEYVTVALPPELHERLLAAAAAERRPKSMWVRNAIEDQLLVGRFTIEGTTTVVSENSDA